MEHQTYLIKFDQVSVAEANRHAHELRNILLDTTPHIQVHQRRDDPQTQDVGSTLVLVLGTPTVIAIAKAIGDWLKLRQSVSLTIEKDGRVIGQNLTGKDALKLAELFLKEK